MSTEQQNSGQKPDVDKTDEKLGVMVFGNLKIRDIDTGKILVNQRA